MFVFQRQPLKSLFLTFWLVTLMLQIPYWMAVSVLLSARGRRSWSLTRQILVNLIRHYLTDIRPIVGDLFHIPNSTKLETESGIIGLWVAPMPQRFLKGDIALLAGKAGICPITIPGYWIHSPESDIKMGDPPQIDEKVFFNLHGGGYTTFSAHPNDISATISRGFIDQRICKRVFSIEYRLSGAGVFPAALLDALSGYLYLTSVVGFSPESIVLVGDSAGGNLALALTRYLVENEGVIPGLPHPPTTLVLLSPWADLRDLDRSSGHSSYQTCEKSDWLAVPTEPAAREFCGPHTFDLALYNRYVSPAGLHPDLVKTLSFKGFPRTFIVVGGAEVLYDSIIRLRDRLVKDMGHERVQSYCAPDGVHDYLCFTWHEPERTDTYRMIKKWLEGK